MKDDRAPLTMRVYNANPRGFAYLCIAYPIFQILFIPIVLFLAKTFPNLKYADFLPGLPAFVFFALILIHCLFSFHKVHLSSDHITLSWLGIPLQTVPSEQLRFLYAVGDERWDQLCLTCLTTDELAAQEEISLSKNFFSKHDLPYLKQKPDYISTLARKHLLRLRNRAFLLICKNGTLFLPMDLILLEQIRTLYPTLPYKNFTECKNCNSLSLRSNQYAPTFSTTVHYCTPEIKDDAIVYKELKRTIATFPLHSVKTIARVDIFGEHSRYRPHHTAVLLLSTLTLEEMIENSPLADGSAELRAYAFAYKQAKSWQYKSTDCCNLYYTQQTLNHLRTHCPTAQHLDLSSCWLTDQEPLSV